MKLPRFVLNFFVLVGPAFCQVPSDLSTLPPGATTDNQVTSLAPEQKRKNDIFTELRAGFDGQGSRDSVAYMQTRALAKAKDSLKRNDVLSAEAFLTALNPFEPNTGDWYFDIAQRWLSVASDLSRQSDRAMVPVVVMQTLQNLGRAEGLARQKSDVRLEASIKTAAGYLHDRYRGDPEAAVTAYREALKLVPNDQPTREALTRLERSLAVLRARTRNRK